MRHVGWTPPWTGYSRRYGVWEKLDTDPLWDDSGYVWVLRWKPPPSIFLSLLSRIQATSPKVNWLEDVR